MRISEILWDIKSSSSTFHGRFKMFEVHFFVTTVPRHGNLMLMSWLQHDLN